MKPVDTRLTGGLVSDLLRCKVGKPTSRRRIVCVCKNEVFAQYGRAFSLRTVV